MNIQTKYNLLTLAIAASFAVSPNSFAQSKESNAGLEVIEVTAQKRAQSVQEVPISISAFHGDSLNDMGIVETDQLGQYVPGLEISTANGEGSQLIVFMRGAGLTDFNANNAGPIGIYSDEVYISSPALTAFQFFDTERLEVLKGPQGTLYGRNTTGGAIKFIANKPTEDLEARAKFSYGNDNTTVLEAAVSGPLSDNIRGRLSFIKNDSDGYGTNLVDGSDINGVDSFAYRSFLEFDYDDLNILVNLHGAKVDSDTTSSVPLGLLNPDGSGTPCALDMIKANQCVDLFGYNAPDDPYKGHYNNVQKVDLDSSGGYIELDYDFGDITITSITAYEKVERFIPEETDGAPTSTLDLFYNVESDTFSQELRIAGGSDSSNWLLGAFYLSENLKQNQTADILSTFRAFTGGLSDPEGVTLGAPILFTRTKNKQEIESYAIFGQYSFNVTDRTTLTVGGRYTDEDRDFTTTTSLEDEVLFGPNGLTLLDNLTLDTQADAFSYRLALDHKFSDKVLGYSSISRGFKSGGFNGGFLSLVPEEAMLQAQPFEPEYLTAYEIGLKSDLLDNKLRLNTAVFFNDFSDLQVFTVIPTGNIPVTVLDNASDAEVIGVEFDATWIATEGLTVALTGAYMDSELKGFTATASGQDFSGNELAYTPKVSLSALIRYEYYMQDGGTLSVQSSAAYKDDQFLSTENNPIIAQDAYTLVNARISYESSEGTWSVAGYVNNLTDKKYKTLVADTSDFGFYQQYFGTPRHVGIELTLNY